MNHTKYTLYLDASGDPGWPVPYGKSPHNFYVLGGLVLTPEAEAIVKEEIQILIRTYILPSARTKELKYTPLIGGYAQFKHLQPVQRKELADKVFSLIDRVKPVIMATVIDKTRLKQKYGDCAYDPKVLAFQGIIARYSMNLKRCSTYGEIIMDDEEITKDNELQKYLGSLKTHGAIIRGRSYNPFCSERYEPLLNSLPLFSSSQESPGIQLADFVVKAVWMQYVKGTSYRFEQIRPFLSSANGKVFEPSVFPKI